MSYYGHSVGFKLCLISKPKIVINPQVTYLVSSVEGIICLTAKSFPSRRRTSSLTEEESAVCPSGRWCRIRSCDVPDPIRPGPDYQLRIRCLTNIQEDEDFLLGEGSHHKARLKTFFSVTQGIVIKYIYSSDVLVYFDATEQYLTQFIFSIL